MDNDKVDHDEPWLTLLALYSIFGDQSKFNDNRFAQLVNMLFSNKGNSVPPSFNIITDVSVEVVLNEIDTYKEYLYNVVFEKKAYHLYPDIDLAIKEKKEKKTASLEGNTHLDALICGENKEGEKKFIFIESKFLSDISKDIKYNTVRDQIIRNIDAAINTVKNVEDFWFFILTPGIFRTELFGGPKESPLSEFSPEKSRLYCYKMDEYKDWKNLKAVLPHRDLEDEEWQTIANHIGWVTFEDFIRIANMAESKVEEIDQINFFFESRHLNL